MMMDKHGLSLVALFDEITRNRAVLTTGVGTEFTAFVMTQEDCRKRWMDAENAVDEMAERLKKVEDEKNTLETKLKHARNQIDVEISKRKRAEEEKDEYEKQIMLVKELLRDKNNSTMLNDHARETLAFLSTDFRSMIQEKSPAVSHTRMESESPDISFDRTGDDLEEKSRKKSKKRPSAPPCDDEENIAPLNKRYAEKSAKRHRRSKSMELELNLAGGPAMVVFDVVSTPRNSKKMNDRRKSSPFAALLRSNSQGLQGEALAGSGDAWSPEMTRMNSGNSLTRPHMFQSVPHFKQDLCYVCNKKLKFGTSGARCKDCKVICHTQCKDLAPLPCMATVNTPKIVKSAPGLITDYAPDERPFVPAIVIHCINEIELRGLKQEGLYRVNGSEKEIKELKEKFLKGKTTPNLSSIFDINVVCGCLKDFLRKLKEPLVTYDLWQSFLEAAMKRDPHDCTSDLYQVVSRLPVANRDTMAYLILHLFRVSENVECKMSKPNLVKVFAPNVVGFSSPDPTPMQMMEQTEKQQLIMSKLMALTSDYWSSFIRFNEVYSTYQPSATPSNGQYRILSKYEEPITTPRNSLRPFNILSTPGLYEASGFNKPIGAGYTGYLKKTTQFFGPPVLK